MKKRKNTLKFIIIILVLSLGLGYAFLTTTLQIEGVTDIDANTWNVYWDNVQVKSGSVTATTPTIDSSKTMVSFNVHLSEPGDYYEFTVDAINDGSIDAMIETITKTINNSTTVPNYLNYTVTYDDDVEIENNHILEAGNKEIYKIRLEYRTDINPSDLPSAAASLPLTFGLTYVQATTDAEEVEHTLAYTVNIFDTSAPDYNMVLLEQAIPSFITKYRSGDEAIAALRTASGSNNIQFSLKHRINNGRVAESYVEFIVTPEMVSAHPEMTAGTYTIRGSGATYNTSTDSFNDDSPYYLNHKAVLLSAFGAENCTDTSSGFYCGINILRSEIKMNGHVYVCDGSWHCSVFAGGGSVCDTE